MNARLLALAWILVILSGLTTTANAQTRLSIEAGVVQPTGDFADLIDSGQWFGVRAEKQAVNALGQIAVLSYFLQAGVGNFDLDSTVEASYAANDLDTDTKYYEFTVGARVYAATMPLFFSAAVGWTNYDPPAGEDVTGFTPTVGAGVAHSFANFTAELEARAHLAMIDEPGVAEPTFVTFSAAIGLPF